MLIILLVSGLLLLYAGAELLVKGSVGMALKAGIPSLVVGLTFVSFGTSSPELVVSIRASLAGSGNIAVGNVIGSNIFNIAVILGISALIRPVKVNLKVLRIDMPVLLIVSIMPLIFLNDNILSRGEAIFFLSGLVAYIFFTIKFGRKEQALIKEHDQSLKEGNAGRPLYLDGLFIAGGMAALIFGSQFFVKGAIELARIFKVSETVIALTIVASGTGLPELATSVVAAVRGEEDIAVGNIVGSNIFNILGILAVSGAISPLNSAGIGYFDIGVMIFTALLLLPLMKTGFRISRAEGVILIAIYIMYLFYLWP